MRSTAIIFFLVISCIFAKAQDSGETDSLNHYQRFDASYIVGGQVYNNNLIYNPGFAFQTSYGIKLNESVGVGFGTGYTKLQDENFIPVFIEAMGCRKNKQSSPMVLMQLGYSFGWYSGNMLIDGYKFHGGIFIDAGLGRKINVNSEYSLFFHWSYRHQFARMDYKVFGAQDYTEGLNYDMIVITLGVIRHCK